MQAAQQSEAVSMTQKTQLQCTECWNRFACDLSALESDGLVYCPVCGHKRRISSSLRIALLEQARDPDHGASSPPA